ncbi:MAG: polysaccharide biosynthesis C-terminal domain-containing protein [Ignavibacteriales bacterium]|nr:polysaccharide biosynthesis C-terminal domain-containing protein [Ignavibacteriales bacterium]MCF8314605.1 polysaccharide biosynthesis C-terminal domain-containing protein [Ignavibacteriales bacterium]MCF8436358.1 polysaccharide biosynthesis C-terminal domain-containing protein [Ignavibacteriales bacterium]
MISTLLTELKTIYSASRYFAFNLFSEKLFSLVFHLLIVKYFSPIDYASFSIFLGFNFIAGTILDLGIPIHLQRLASGKKILNEFSDAISLRFSFILLQIASAVIYLIISGLDNITLILIITVSSSIGSLINFYNHFLFGKQNFKLIFKASFISRIFLITLILVIILYLSEIEYIAAAMIFANLLQIKIIITGEKVYPEMANRIAFGKESYALIKQSFPLGLNQIINILYDRVDILILPMFIPVQMIASYAFSYLIYKLPVVLLSPLFVIFFNKIAARQQSGKVHLLQKYFVIIFIIGLLLAMLIGFIVAPLADYYIGAKISSVEEIIKILSFAFVFLAMNSITGIYLNASGKYEKVLTSSVLGLSVNLIFNFSFLTKYGIIAAAYATLLTEITILTVQGYHILRK